MNVPYTWLLSFFEDLGTSENRLSNKLAELVSADGLAAGHAEFEAAKLLKLRQLLDGLGLSVERVLELPTVPDGVVVAEITSLKPVAGSDHLLLAEIRVGEATAQVVTGAPNAAVGLRTALAQPGAVLPAVGLEVSVRELAGVRSEGVLCSPRELGVHDYGGGLIAFGDDASLGAELKPLWPAETVIELELTPNRADAFSLLGVARDLAAKLGIPYLNPANRLRLGDPKVEDGLNVEIADPQGCPRFVLQRIDGLTLKPSPLWLQRRLAALGLRPRNNLVDVTNYVTFELGQPSHAYDLADLQGGSIVVRRAHAGETLEALNEVSLSFTEADLLITTPIPPSQGGAGGGTRPIGVAGVIGGLHHSVKPATTSVALEVAHFDPVSVRKTAKRLGLSTDAHTRFERGVDPNLPPRAAARAAQLMAELGGGMVHAGSTEVGGDVPCKEIVFRPSRVAFLTALEVPSAVQRAFLERLGCTVVASDEDRWQVSAPSWRFDLAVEDDLVEEVARLYGYEHIPQTVPVMDFVPSGADTTHRGLRTLLVGMGFQETLTYSFLGDDDLARAAAPAAHVRLASPPSQERSVLRTALLPGLLAAAHTNHNERLALFEIGRVFVDDELERLAVLMRGPWAESDWLGVQKPGAQKSGVQKNASADEFYTFKGLFEKLAATLGARFRLVPALGAARFPALHPGVSAAVLWNDQEVGFLGQLHPEVAARFELGVTFVAELALPLEGQTLAFREFSRQPFAERDVAIVAPTEVPYAALAALVAEAAGERLESLSPFDVYAGAPIPEGKRSVALRLHFRHPERALGGDEVDRLMEKVTAALVRGGYGVRDR